VWDLGAATDFESFVFIFFYLFSFFLFFTDLITEQAKTSITLYRNEKYGHESPMNTSGYYLLPTNNV